MPRSRRILPESPPPSPDPSTSEPPCASIPCWLCRRPVHVRRSKDGHHFVSCLDCGMQTFIRSSAGEQHLLEMCRKGQCH